MAVANTNSSVSYDGDDVSTAFPTTFKFLANADLEVATSDDDGVTWTALVLGDTYEVSGAGDPEPGGTVTLDDPLASGTTLRIVRSTPIVQPVVMAQSGPIPVRSLTGELDRLTLIAQEQDRRIAALEALGNLVNVTDLADGVDVNAELETLDPIEDSFPFVIAVAGGGAAKQALFRIDDDDDDEDFNSEAFAVNWLPGPGANEITVRFITGLKPSNFYAVHARVLF